jgi:hypothetical protein
MLHTRTTSATGKSEIINDEKDIQRVLALVPRRAARPRADILLFRSLTNLPRELGVFIGNIVILLVGRMPVLAKVPDLGIGIGDEHAAVEGREDLEHFFGGCQVPVGEYVWEFAARNGAEGGVQGAALGGSEVGESRVGAFARATPVGPRGFDVLVVVSYRVAICGYAGRPWLVPPMCSVIDARTDRLWRGRSTERSRPQSSWRRF